MTRAEGSSMIGAVLGIVIFAAAGADVPASAPATAAAAPAPPPPEAEIPFANKGGIWTWRVIDDKTVLIESQARNWYKATLFGNCINLSFANELAFIPSPSGSFDKFSTIRSHGQRCPLVSLVATAAPPKKSAAKKSGATPPNPLTSP